MTFSDVIVLTVNIGYVILFPQSLVQEMSLVKIFYKNFSYLFSIAFVVTDWVTCL